jgi:hypothetical protein
MIIWSLPLKIWFLKHIDRFDYGTLVKLISIILYVLDFTIEVF